MTLQTVERAYTLARAKRSSRMLPEGSASLPIVQSAPACQNGIFTAGSSLGDAHEFNDWVAVQREGWHCHLSLILDRSSEIQFVHDEFTATTETALQWIALDTLNETANRRRIHAG